MKSLCLPATLLVLVSMGRALQASPRVSPAAAQRSPASQTTSSPAPSPAEVARAESEAAQHPNDPLALTTLAELRLRENDETAARQLLVHAIEISPNNPRANLLLGQILLQGEHLPEAMDRFETVLRVSHDDAARAGELAAATRLALKADQAGNQAAAYRCLEHASESLPDSAELLTDLGLVAEQLHLLDHARDALQRALAIEPRRPEALYALGRIELEAQHLATSERYLRAYLAQRPDDATAWFGLGRVLHMQQRDAEAETALRRSLELVPLQTESYYELGAIALDAHRDAEAKELFAKTLSRDPGHGGALTGMGEIAYRAHDFAAAKQALTAAVASAPTYQPAHYYLGLTLARLGEKGPSDAELARATDLSREQQGKAKPVAPEQPPTATGTSSPQL